MPRKQKAAEPLATMWRVSDTLWGQAELVLAEFDPPARFGPDLIDQRKALDGVIYRMRSGVQWNQLLRELGHHSSVHRTFQRWVQRGVIDSLWALLNRCRRILIRYEKRRRITWPSWNSPAHFCGSGDCTGSRLEMVSQCLQVARSVRLHGDVFEVILTFPRNFGC